jgi:phage portal protein BeeE
MGQHKGAVTVMAPRPGAGLIQKAVWALVNFSRSLSLTDPSGWQSDGSAGSQAGERVTPDSVLGLSTAFACISLNAGTIGSLPMEVVRKNSKGLPESAWDHPLNMIIRVQPNADEAAMGFWEFIQASLELEGNGYAEKMIGAGGRVIGLRSLDPGTMDVTRNSDGRRRYRWTERGVAQSHLEDDILHIPGFGYGGARLRGISTLARRSTAPPRRPLQTECGPATR